MRAAETVTFGGLGGLDRAAWLRGDETRQRILRTAPSSRVLPVWRGKPLIAGEGRDALGLLPVDHPALRDAGLWLYLGQVEERAIYAAELSGFQPTGVDAAAEVAFFDPGEQSHPDLPGDHRFTELRGVMTSLSPLDAEIAATARGLFEWHRSHGFCARCGQPSEAAVAGWQRNCGACGASHFPRTDPVAIMLVTRGDNLLLGRSRGWPAGMYSLLAGFIEPGETLEAAVRREVFEEAGIRVGAVRYLASQPWPFPASLMLGCHGEATSEEIDIDPQELEHALWISREEMVEVLAGRHPVVKGARRGAIAHFLMQAWVADSLD
ncbi:NAD(+) diphosphatase [Falsigemmobacter intermedius]|uniref:NAD(+) diphosphatase n=1 Tax=Falsigemmobacter intermedius TaxID=1553448 RepID=A0A3S3VQQ1_9RHOB|nr:NAD(+) diphosphatase [Falsigemmobacter intermedius]RWY40588.1 NAD(+) diphosphatase [Falsigemmobacter intermedius]